MFLCVYNIIRTYLSISILLLLRYTDFSWVEKITMKVREGAYDIFFFKFESGGNHSEVQVNHKPTEYL